MNNDKLPLGAPVERNLEGEPAGGVSRRDFLKGGAAGLTVGGIAGAGLGASLSMSAQAQAGPPRGQGRVLLERWHRAVTGSGRGRF